MTAEPYRDADGVIITGPPLYCYVCLLREVPPARTRLCSDACKNHAADRVRRGLSPVDLGWLPARQKTDGVRRDLLAQLGGIVYRDGRRGVDDEPHQLEAQALQALRKARDIRKQTKRKKAGQ